MMPVAKRRVSTLVFEFDEICKLRFGKVRADRGNHGFDFGVRHNEWLCFVVGIQRDVLHLRARAALGRVKAAEEQNHCANLIAKR